MLNRLLSLSIFFCNFESWSTKPFSSSTFVLLFSLSLKLVEERIKCTHKHKLKWNLTLERTEEKQMQKPGVAKTGIRKE